MQTVRYWVVLCWSDKVTEGNHRLLETRYRVNGRRKQNPEQKWFHVELYSAINQEEKWGWIFWARKFTTTAW